MFITIEGPEGSGKSTVVSKVAARLEDAGYDVVCTREPGGTKISEEIRNIIFSNDNMDDKTEALLYAASRRQHLVEKIWPALERGAVVICDRYIDSSIVYQGIARHIGICGIIDINMFATDESWPDVTFLLDLDPRIGLARIAANPEREVNRIDMEDISFHERVREGFLEEARDSNNRIEVIDADDSVENIVDLIISKLKSRGLIKLSGGSAS